MEVQKIPSDDGNGFYTAMIDPDFEYVNPIDYTTERTIKYQTSVMTDILKLKDPKFAEVAEKVAYKQALEFWNEQYQEIIETEIPTNFITLLSAESKREQEKLLRNQSFTPLSLIAFIFKAHTDFNFLHSQYTGRNYHKVDLTALPKLAHVKEENGLIEKAGSTSMTDGQIKNAIFQRKKVVAKFLDHGHRWHCFFITYKSIRGEETWENGQPHYHYISDKWGIPRATAVEQLKSNRYPSTSVHIKLLDYGKQPNG